MKNIITLPFVHSLEINKEMIKVIGLKGLHGVLTIGYHTVKYYHTPPRTPLSVVGLE